MFDNKRDWEDHEMKHHHRSLVCQFCGSDLIQDPADLKVHVMERHGLRFNAQQFNAFLKGCYTLRDYFRVDACELCEAFEPPGTANEKKKAGKAAVVSRHDFMRHVANHLEQIALFALPRTGMVTEMGTNEAGGQLEGEDDSSQALVSSIFALMADHLKLTSSSPILQPFLITKMSQMFLATASKDWKIARC